MEAIDPTNLHLLRTVADQFDCLTVEDFCLLYSITPGTADSWRRRGNGPDYILAGNRYLYPRTSVAADLQSRQRVRGIPTTTARVL